MRLRSSGMRSPRLRVSGGACPDSFEAGPCVALSRTSMPDEGALRAAAAHLLQAFGDVEMACVHSLPEL